MAREVTALRVVAPLAWTALIAWFSAPGWSAADTGTLLAPLLRKIAPWARPEQIEAVHWLVRKGAHVFEYAALAGLWRWALATEVARASRIALFLCAVTAGLDEWHQATTTTRTGSPADVVLDTSAAVAALLALTAGHRALDRLIAALLWFSAIGGLLQIAINRFAAVPSGWLWVSVPAAWLALLAWRRRRPLT